MWGREFGFGMKLTPLQLDVINQERDGWDSLCWWSCSLLKKLSTITKSILTESPLQSQVGIWCKPWWLLVIWGHDTTIWRCSWLFDCSSRSCQLWLLFLFYRSNDHDKMREGGLCLTKTLKNWWYPMQYAWHSNS